MGNGHETKRFFNDWENALTFVTAFIGFSVALYVASLTRVQARLTTNALESTRKSQRPVVGISTMNTHLREPLRPRAVLDLKFGNFGLTPALEVTMSTKWGSAPAEPEGLQQRLMLLPGAPTLECQLRIPFDATGAPASPLVMNFEYRGLDDHRYFTTLTLSWVPNTYVMTDIHTGELSPSPPPTSAPAEPSPAPEPPGNPAPSK